MALDSIDPPEPAYPAWLTVWRLDRTVDSRIPRPEDFGRYHSVPPRTPVGLQIGPICAAYSPTQHSHDAMHIGGNARPLRTRADHAA